jgi:hypothetical protein
MPLDDARDALIALQVDASPPAPVLPGHPDVIVRQPVHHRPPPRGTTAANKHPEYEI